VRNLLSSPRRRRRLGWGFVTTVVVTGVAAGVVLMPRGEGRPPEVLRPGPVQKVEREVPLTRATRSAIDATIARFVPAAMGRKDPALAWTLSGPGLRAGTTRSEWLRGSSPVFPYPFRDPDPPGWKPLYTYRNRVGFDLLFHPRKGAKLGAIAVKVEMVRRGGSWLVDTWYPAAVWAAPDERPWVAGPADYAAGGYTSDWYDHKPVTEGRLDARWLLVPAGLVALVAAAPLTLAGATRMRRRG
jgi:hypothetical protein